MHFGVESVYRCALIILPRISHAFSFLWLNFQSIAPYGFWILLGISPFIWASTLAHRYAAVFVSCLLCVTLGWWESKNHITLERKNLCTCKNTELAGKGTSVWMLSSKVTYRAVNAYSPFAVNSTAHVGLFNRIFPVSASLRTICLLVIFALIQ